MCGLNGIFAYHDAANSPAQDELLKTRDRMAARGPDGAGCWWSADRRIAFGHRRLSILDLSDRASQPMISPDGSLVVVFNGEIYNMRELRGDLQAEGVEFRTSSDTEVLLRLFARDGKAMAGRLIGMFALAIWDNKARSLFLARDPYGIKPLYYANDGWTFRFASQVKALLAGGAISRDPEPAGLVGFHLWGHVPEPFTLYRNIRSVPAGHSMLIDRWGPREPERYWSIAKTLAGSFVEDDPRRRAARIGRSVAESVRRHLLSDVEVGVFLSAGVDSGAVLGLARDAGLDSPSVITLAFEEFRGTNEDEVPPAATVAGHYAARHFVRTVGEAEFRADLPAILDAMDQPSIDGVNTWFVAKAAREAGLKVALSGLGGDELLAGYPGFLDLPRWRRRYGGLARIPGLGRAARAALQAWLPETVRKRPKAAYLLEYAATWEGAYLLRRGLFMPGELDRMLQRDIIYDGLRRLAPLGRLRQSLQPDPGSETARVGALEASHYLRDQLLRDADWAGMAHSLEIRAPLVDSSLLASVAPALKRLRPGEGKRALGAAPSLPLPASIMHRGKTGFSVPTGDWLGRASGAAASNVSRGLVSRAWAQAVLGQFRAGADGLPDAEMTRAT